MAIRYHVEADTGIVVAEAIGVVQTAEYLEFWGTLADDPRVEPGMRLVADFRGVKVERTGGEVRSIADAMKRSVKLLEGGRFAIVAASDASYGLARMFETLVSALSLSVRVFRDFDEARSWVLDGDD